MLALAGLGAVLTIVGVVVFGPVVARPASRVIGAPLRLLRGVTGSLARENAMRNPRRTAGTAAALMVGVGVVTLFTDVRRVAQGVDRQQRVAVVHRRPRGQHGPVRRRRAQPAARR